MNVLGHLIELWQLIFFMRNIEIRNKFATENLCRKQKKDNILRQSTFSTRLEDFGNGGFQTKI